MKRILVIGSCGAGKSTIARRLHEITGLKLVHLDKLYWQPNWVETPKDIWEEKVREAIKDDSWIMDGNYGGTMELRMAACDTVVWVDFSRTVCTWRVIKRILTYRKKGRSDMAAGCDERFDREFIKYVWNFPRDKSPLLKSRLAKYKEKKVFRLRSNREIESFLEEISNNW